jgi:hypothetical protein
VKNIAADILLQVQLLSLPDIKASASATLSTLLQVLYRRARARLLQQQYTAAAADAQAAVDAAQQAGDAASADDALQLLQTICAAQAAAVKAAGEHAADEMQQLHLRSAQVAGCPAPQCNLQQQPQQQQQQQQCHEPPSGPSLQQLNLLLQHHAWQAAQLQQQQQQPVLLRCCYSSAAGRHVVAAADIPPGSILLVEQPLAAVTVRQRRSTAAAAGGQARAEGKGAVAAAGCCEWCFGALGVAPWTCTHCPMVSVERLLGQQAYIIHLEHKVCVGHLLQACMLFQ